MPLAPLNRTVRRQHGSIIIPRGSIKRDMSPKRTIKGKEIVSDIRSGMTDNELMKKYTLSEGALKNVFRKLVDAGAIREDELRERIPQERLPSYTKRERDFQRNYVFVRLPVYDMENLLDEGQVVDISERGLQIMGISAAVGETKGFLIQADYFAEVFPFSFEAECKWASKNEAGQWTAGFKIVKISEGGLEELQKLIRMLSLS